MVVKDFQEQPARVLLGLKLRHLQKNNIPVELPSGGVGGNTGFWGQRREAPSDCWRTDSHIDTAKYDPERVALALLRELYAWFGHTEEDVPFTEGTGDEKRISTTAIKAIG